LAYLKIIRPVNLLLILLAQFLLKYTLLEPAGVSLALSPTTFVLFVLAIVLIAAGGNVINDIYDVGIDTINKPSKVYVGAQIAEKNAFNYYILLTVIGVGIGFYISNSVDKPALSVFFIGTAALLYTYASSLKAIVLVGNVIISALVALSLLLLILFDIFPAFNETDRLEQLHLSGIIWSYSLAAFYINLIREIVKDIQDVNGDKNGGRITIPIALGIDRSLKLVFILGLIAFFMVVYFSYYELYQHRLLLFYFLFLLGGTLLLFCIKAWNAEKPKHYPTLSLLLKVILLLGTGSIPLYATIYLHV
jgi:4-hydroxybenzoate polyprenyltransferase